MSRHTYVRNMNVDEEYEDDEYAYGSSYGTPGSDYGLSSSVEQQYMFRRDQSGTTPKMSSYLDRQASAASLGDGEAEFEMDLGCGPPQASALPPDPGDKKLRRCDSVFDTSGMSSEDKAKLNSCLDHILDIVGETVQEFTIKEAIVRCKFDVEKALNYILNKPSQGSPIAHASPPKKSKLKLEPEIGFPIRKASAPVVKALPSTKVSVVGFNAPGLSSNVGFDVNVGEPIKTIESLKSDPKRSRSNSPLPNRLETLTLETPKKADANDNASAPTPMKQVVMRKVEIDPAEEFKKNRGDAKESLNLVVIGHVDSGKSTLMGHLLFQLGQVSQKVMHKHEQESRKVGKQSFMYAWVLDETDEERERGITMDVGQNKFETDNRIITLLDAPGHRDFIPNMISGAYQADVAVLVVNATTGEFEAGFEAGGQTREHALLVRSLGVAQLTVAVNKLDTVEWDQGRFLAIKEKLRLFLTKQAGFREADLTFIPCSGLTGENLTLSPRTELLSTWYKGHTLMQAIDNLKTPTRAMDKPFRLSVSDIFRAQSGSGFSVAGRVEAGVVMKDDRVLISPLNEICTVKSVLVEQMDSLTGFAGDHVVLTLVGPDQASVVAGMVLCDPSQPVPVATRFQARVVVFNIEVPITKGYPVVLHYGCVSEQATIKKLVSILNKSNGEVVKSKPRCLTGNQSAVVEIIVSRPIPLELYKSNRELGRFMLRTGGHTIAAGMVTEIL
eukprot:TRINITY_DN6513_c0_g1_i1.p1 TRINITY_DN6513_c0_g1~~TRINITY_DN6513_c0_g1_i1.p1  ORF type:complete len:727 (-),score=240.56 TRINITY_DN6513_c0_g1_i1:146-2326(-)